MNLLVVLKYILPLTIVFDAFISLFLIRKVTHNKQVRFFTFALITFVLWEIAFWFSIYTDYGLLVNGLVDRLGFSFGLLAQFFLMLFLTTYPSVQLPKLLQKSITLLSAIAVLLVIVIGIGSRDYLGSETYNYTYLQVVPYSFVLGSYYVVSFLINVAILYLVRRLIQSGLSFLEIARRRLVRNSVMVALVVTIVPTIVIPLIILLLGENVQVVLAADWYITTMVIGAIVSSVWTATTAYAMTRYRLFDVTVKIKRSLLLAGCATGLTILIFAVDYFIVAHYLSGTGYLLVNALLVLVALVTMVVCTRKFGVGDPISFALSEPVTVDTTVQQLAQRMQNYLQNEFEISVHEVYLLDPKNHNFINTKTGIALANLPEATLKQLQTELVMQEHLPSQLKSATALVALITGDFLLGFITISTAQSSTSLSSVKQGIIDATKYFAQLLYQAMFSSLLYESAAKKLI